MPCTLEKGAVGVPPRSRNQREVRSAGCDGRDGIIGLMEDPPRYDGLAGWYDEHLAEFTLAASDVLARLLGPGPGRCLDLCCGTGLHLPRLLDLGWRMTGVDISADQLRVARDRVGKEPDLVRADATELPFGDGHFEAAVTVLSHTDVDDFPALVREGARVLQPGGPFVYAGYTPASSARTLGWRRSRASRRCTRATAKCAGTPLPSGYHPKACAQSGRRAPAARKGHTGVPRRSLDARGLRGARRREYPVRIALRARRPG
jgi:SAM-dependent methyltransferase